MKNTTFSISTPMRTRLATFSNREWVSITSQTEKKTPMNYIIINKTKNISYFGNYSKYTSTC